MKMPATVEMIDGQVTLKVRTRAYSGEIQVSPHMEGTRFDLPGVGTVEDGQEVFIEISLTENIAKDPKRYGRRNPGYQMINDPPGERNFGKEVRSFVPKSRGYSTWPG